MDAAYKKYTIAQSVKLNFIEKCSNMKVKHPKDYWLEYERKMLENINERLICTAGPFSMRMARCATRRS